MKKLFSVIAISFILLFGGMSTNADVARIDDHTIMVYDQFKPGDDVKFRVETNDLKYDTLTIIINSPGGRASVFMDIMHHVKELKGRGYKIVTKATGNAASAGALLFILGDERIAYESTLFMFHGVQLSNPVTGQRVPYEVLTDDDKKIVDLYNNWMLEELTPIVGKKKARELVSEKEVYLSGKEAYELGIVTKLLK